MRSLLVIFLGANILWRENFALIIASSKLTVCDNFEKNPHNVVDNKSCEKKLIITQAIQSGQGGTEALLFRTNKLYDELQKEEARLYYPFIVTLSKSPVRLVYPFYYKATVNNHPHEEVRNKVKCRSEYHANESATCGFAYNPDGNKIWDSQGFCCSCSRYDYVPKWLRKVVFGGHVKRFYRGGQGGLCGYSHKHGKSDRTTHCMRLDNLWYDAFAIGLWRLSFTLDVQAYDQVEKVVDNKTVTEWVDGGKLVLNYRKRSAVGKHGRLLAHFIGSFPGTDELPRLKGQYLLIPKTGTSFAVQNHVQTRNGFKDYMIVRANMIAVRDNYFDKCDVIGVSYSSFRKQGGGHEGRGAGCEQPRDSCLKNQPKDLFEEDTALREAGKRPKYFVDKNGNCIGVNRKGPSEDLGLVYELDETMTSIVTLEVSADDMILIYNRATGVIVKTIATNFDALSHDGKMTVVIQNTGLVTADFYVVFAGCSDGVIVNNERTASINPKAVHAFQYTLDVFLQKGKRHFCEVQLYDSRRHLQDKSNITFKTFTPCVCLQNCVCKCNAIDTVDVDEDDNGDNACNEQNDHDGDYDDEDDTESGGSNIFTKTWRSITRKIDGGLFIVLLLLPPGIAKAILGRQSLTIAKIGRGGVRTGKKVTKTIKGEKKTLVYNNAMDLVDATTNELVVPNNATWDFCANIFFFFLLPVFLVAGIAKAILSFCTIKPIVAQKLPVTAPRPEKPAHAPKTQKSALETEGDPKPPASDPKPKRLHKPVTVAANVPKLKGIPKLIAHAPKSKGTPKLTANTPKLKGSSKKSKTKSSK